MASICIVDLSAGHAAPGANTDILEASDIVSGYSSGADIQVPAIRHGAILRVTMCVTGGTTVFKAVDDTGTDLDFNGGTALTADSVYTFDLVASKDRTYNFQIETDRTISYLMVNLVWDGVE